ncbi:type II toxin-antitoxin system VapC family toxin [Janibacter anophelis]|uniref:type II toxin-antitoxin system VapC family toxin n=1 Tax=Janibacter anophelis TaxID=319054 RepID=UPI0008371C42|nr:type II toxin-antitoxin system VapC family toxin [Janibacter anophelis]
MSRSDQHTCDTSVLVPALASWHEHHEVAGAAMARCTALPGHVLLETLSVLTRLPAPHRLDGPVVLEALEQLDLPVITLSPDGHLEALRRLTARGLRGGTVYDGLVASTAKEHDHALLTRDRRARQTYEAVGVRLAPISS